MFYGQFAIKLVYLLKKHKFMVILDTENGQFMAAFKIGYRKLNATLLC